VPSVILCIRASQYLSRVGLCQRLYSELAHFSDSLAINSSLHHFKPYYLGLVSVWSTSRSLVFLSPHLWSVFSLTALYFSSAQLQIPGSKCAGRSFPSDCCQDRIVPHSIILDTSTRRKIINAEGEKSKELRIGAIPEWHLSSSIAFYHSWD